jgi:tetratricopeptide (TPR) repeat protein
MSNETDLQELDISLPFQERIDILFREIELAVRWDRPSILFAIYKSDIVRDEVNSILQEKLNNLDQKTHSIKTSFNNQFDFLEQIAQLPDLSKTVLLIDGFNWECGPEGARVFKEFNKNREYFVDNNIRAIFWLFEKEVSDFASNATECWVLRHRMVEFVDVPQSDQETIQSLESLWKSSDTSPVAENVPGKSFVKGFHVQDKEMANANAHSSRANAFLNLGILFWRKGNLKRALKYVLASKSIGESLADQPLIAQCHNALGLVYSELGNIDEAVEAYQSAISFSPELEFLWNNLGQLLSKNERNEEAINAFNKALLCSPRDFLSLNGIGHIYIKLGVFQNAISAFEKALDIAPNYEASWAGLGWSYLETEQLEKAEVALRKAVELNPQLIDAWKNLGKCFSKQKRDIDAIAVYRKAIEFNPQIADLWDELGKLLLQRHNYPECILAFQKVVALDPKCSEASIRLAHALFQIGDYETSASIYEGSIPLFEDILTRSALFNRLGDAYLYLKDYEKAIGAYKRSEELQIQNKNSDEKIVGLTEEIPEAESNNVNEMDQDNHEEERGDEMIEANHIFDSKTASEWNEQGNIHFKAGAYNDAIVAYTKAIELAPEASWPYIQNLAQVHYQKGKVKGKQLIGKVEDTEVWEGDQEEAPVIGYDALINQELAGDNQEPGLEKPSKNDNPEETPDVKDFDIQEMKNSDPDSSCACNSNTNKQSEENINIDITEKPEPNHEALQTLDVEPGPSPDQTISSDPAANGPQTSSDWNELGNAFAAEKKFNNAIEAYKKSIEIDPTYGQPYSNLGFMYYRLGKYDFAVLLFKRSIDLLDTSGDKSVSWNRLGDSYRRLGDYGNALSAYKKSSEIAPPTSPVMARARATLLENIAAS